MRGTRRIVAGFAASLMLAIAFMPAAAAPKASRFRPAVVDRALAAKLVTAKPAQFFETIVSVWDRNVLRELDRMKVKHRKLQVLPMAFTKLSPLQITRLVGTDGVRSVWSPRKFQLHLNESGRQIGARQAAEQLGVDGTGSTVAVIDTGVDGLHPDLPWHDKVLGNYEVLVPGIFDPGEPLVVDSPNTDDDSHGTHTSGTVAGSGAGSPEGKNYAGVAPGAKLIVYSANIGLSLLETHTTAAFDHIIANAPTTKVRAISNSWGGGGGADYSPDDPTAIAQETAYKHGIVPVFSAGNSGNAGDETPDGVNTLGQQCVSPYVVCVAASTKHNQITTFSSRGRPTGLQDRALALRYRLGVYRPTITAPGVDIIAPSALSAAADDQSPPWGYQSLSGTSMSCPHVTGVIALMTAANPNLTPAQIIQILESTADPEPGWDAFEEGAGMVNAFRAVQAALALKRGEKLALPTPQFDYVPPARTTKVLETFEGTTIPASFAHHQGVETHEFDVPQGVERLKIDLDWSTPAENMYMYVWAPGDEPNDEDPQAEPYPTQESWGLLCSNAVFEGPCMLTHRESVIAYPKPGKWKLRVFARTLGLTYTVTVNALTYALPSISATSEGGMLSGTATFPAADLTPVPVAPALNTPVLNPTISPRAVYFHGSSPLGNLDVLGGTSPGWDEKIPTGDTPKTAHAVSLANDESEDAAPILAHFAGTLAKPIDGDVQVVAWAGGTPSVAFFAEWTATIISEGEVIGTGTSSPLVLGPAPTRIVISVPHVRLAAGKPMTVQIVAFGPDTHHSVFYYDSAGTPSGLILPEVKSLSKSATGTLTIDGLLGEDLRDGSVRLSWAGSAAASAYRIYRGTDPLRQSVVQTIKNAAAKGKALPPAVFEGSITLGNPASQGGASVTENDFLLEGCTDQIATQGVDGYVIKLPEGAGDGLQTITTQGEGDLYDLDLQFWNEDCSADTGDIATESPDETGTIPKDSAWVVVNLWVGVEIPFKLTVTQAGAASGSQLKAVLAGAGAQVPVYFRVAAVDRKGNEGPASDIVAFRPAVFEHVVEVSRDGKTWREVPAGLAANGRKAAFRLTASAAARAAGITAAGPQTLWVRSRAGDAISVPMQVRVLSAGAVDGAPKPGVLPATGLATQWMLALALLFGCAATTRYLRRAS